MYSLAEYFHKLSSVVHCSLLLVVVEARLSTFEKLNNSAAVSLTNVGTKVQIWNWCKKMQHSIY